MEAREEVARIDGRRSTERPGVGDSRVALVRWAKEFEPTRQIFQGGTYLVPSFGPRSIRTAPEDKESSYEYYEPWAGSHFVVQIHGILTMY